MRIRYFCHYGQLTGYGRAARDYLAALALHLRHLDIVNEPAAGVATDHAWGGEDFKLDIVAYEDLHQHAPGFARGTRNNACSPEPRYQHLDELVTPVDQLVAADVEIHHAPPRLLAQIARGETGAALEIGPIPPARRRVALTTWETDVFPAEYAAVYRGRTTPEAGFDRVLLPSRFSAEPIANAFMDDMKVESGGTKVVPHCYDPAFWAPAPRWRARDIDPAAPGAAGLPFRFYTIGAGGERKNGLAVLKAYLAAFTADDSVNLTMVIGGSDGNEIRSVMARSGIPAEKLPPVTVINNAVDENILREIHGDADCFVSATRGEGWGLGLFEAAIMGRWIISPLWGGQADFLAAYDIADERYPWLLDVGHALTPCFGSEVRGEITKDAAGRLVQSAKVSIPPGVTCKQMWAEPALDEMIECMQEIYQHRVATVTGKEISPAISMRTLGEMKRTAENLDYVAAGFAQRFGYAPVGELFYNTLKEILSHE